VVNTVGRPGVVVLNHFQLLPMPSPLSVHPMYGIGVLLLVAFPFQKRNKNNDFMDVFLIKKYAYKTYPH